MVYVLCVARKLSWDHVIVANLIKIEYKIKRKIRFIINEDKQIRLWRSMYSPVEQSHSCLNYSQFQGREDLKYLQAYSWWECWQCSWTCKGEIRTPIKSASNAPYTSSFEKSKSTLHDEDHDADDNEEECVKLNSKLVLMVEELKGLVGKDFQVL